MSSTISKALAIFLVFQLFQRSTLAQSQSAVFEIEYKDAKNEVFLPISLKEQGIALLHSNLYQWHFVKLDKNLNQEFELSFELKRAMTCTKYLVIGNKLFVLLIETVGYAKDVLIFQFDLFNRKVTQFRPTLIKGQALSDFIVLGENIVFSGHLKNEPMIISQKISNQVAPPRLIEFLPKSIFYDMKPLTDTTCASITADEEKKYLIFDEVNVNDNKIKKRKLELGKDRRIFSAMLAQASSKPIIVGTWTINNSLRPNGVFTVSFTGDSQDSGNVKVYTFTELNHFLEFLPAKKVDRLIEKMRNEKVKGEDFRYELDILPVRLTSRPDGFDFFCIVHDNTSNWNATGKSSGWSTTLPFSSDAGNTDLRPEVVSSNMIKINFAGEVVNTIQASPESLRSMNIKSISDFCDLGRQTSILFCRQNSLTVVSKNGDNQTKSRDVVTLKTLPNEEEIISETGTSNVAHWYEDSFCVYGFRTVKDKSTEKARNVFFINKVESN